MKPVDHRRRGGPVSINRDGTARGSRLAAGVLLVIVQGPLTARAADLPQALTGINARFEGAALPTVTGSSMVIDQFADKATLHWQSFDIGAGHSVEFRQPSSSAVALNRIFDGKPSEIRGRLTANGQVYLINSNGIVFGDGAQVNTQSLIASTLDIDDQVYEQIGFVNAINDTAGPLPAFDSLGRPMGEIHLEPGATLDAAKGGRILIFAPKITNEGTIRTPEGQQVLAASRDKVYLAASEDPDLRGLLVEVSTGGDVSNLGTLLAERGNVSLVGMAVNQEGVARATTSVSLGGSISLRAQDMAGSLSLRKDLVPRSPKPSRGGELRLGAGSVTEVVPDASPGEDGQEVLAFDAQTQPLSRVELNGTTVQVAGGARVTSTGGVVDLTAAANPDQANLKDPGDPAIFNAEVVIEAGASIDVSGDDSTVVSVARNVVEVEARGNELADSPQQRDGPIRNARLRVDSRRGTDFLDIDGAVGGIGRSAAERQSVGGSINVQSEGRFVLEDGAHLDVSGGRVTYTADVVRTSRLRQADGKVVEIGNADPDQTYAGLADDLIVREAGYVEGRDAGTLTAKARGIDLQGELLAGSVGGTHQRLSPGAIEATVPTFVRPWSQTPLGGRLELSLLGPNLQEMLIGDLPAVTSPAVAPMVLSADWLRASGATRISLGNAGAVTLQDDLELPAWGELELSGTRVSVEGDLRIAGGEVNLVAKNTLVGRTVVPDEDLLVQVDGTIDLGGAWVNDSPLLNRGVSSAPIVLDGGTLAIDSGFSIMISDASRLDVGAGAWHRADGYIEGGDGGSMSFVTGVDEIDPVHGALLDLGGELRAFGFGAGGTLEIATERIRIVPTAEASADDDPRLDASRLMDPQEVADTSGHRQYVLDIDAGAFERGGFRSFSLESTRNDLEVTDQAAVRLRAANLQFSGNAAALAPTGTGIGSLAAPAFAPDFARSPMSLALKSTEQILDPIGAVAQLRIGSGASIVADAGSAISLGGETGISVDGSIEAPAGSIELRLGGGAGIFRPEQMIRLGSAARLNADGAALIDTLDPRGLRRGQVLDAGRIALEADQGSIVGAAGAAISVDGVAAVLDTGAGLPVRREVAGDAGTIKLIAAESLLWQGSLSGAAPEGSTASGGRLTLGIDPTDRGVDALLSADGIPRGPHTLVMQDFAGMLPAAGEAVDPLYYGTGFVPVSELVSGGFAALDAIVRSSATGTDDAGIAVPDTPQSLPTIEFPVDLALHLDRSIRLDAAVFSTSDAEVVLDAPYVGIGYGDTRLRLDGVVPDMTSTSNPRNATTPIRLAPSAGEGVLSIAGDLVEFIGEAVTQGFGDAAAGRDGVIVDAAEDLRLRGVRTQLRSDYAGLFRTAGNLVIDAGRVYPTTLTAFELGVEGSGGRIVLGDGGATSAPLSAGGKLTLRADEILQGGALYAPLGELHLEATSLLRFAPGSLTSTSAVGLDVPFFRTEPGGALILPAPGRSEDQIVFVTGIENPEFERLLPEKRIELSAPVIELRPGSLFDLRGGGHVAASEFVPGPGGSRDILLADLDTGNGVEINGSFAILPGIGEYAPYDPLETPAAEAIQGLRIGDTLVLEEGIAGLPAGEYAVLPVRYALYGGFLVTPAGLQDLQAGQSLQRLDGTPIVAGRHGVAGSAAADSRTQGFAIEDGGHVRTRAEYLLTALDDLYEGTRAPHDAGSLAIRAGDTLQLQGELIRNGVTAGLGSAVDIATTAALSVVDELTGAGGIELRADDLAGLGADSLLLGGVRSDLTDGLSIEALASEVRVEAGVGLEQPELLLVGHRIVVDGATDGETRLTSSAAVREETARVEVEGDAALLALSGRRLLPERDTAAGTSSLQVAANARLEAEGGVVLDAAGEASLDGRIEMGAGGLLSLGAAQIAIGETDGQNTGSGLVLSNETLTDLGGGDLRLRSRGAIDVFGELLAPVTGAQIGFHSLAIDAQGLRGHANAGRTVRLAADVIELANSTGMTMTTAPADAGSALRLDVGRELRLGEGVVALGGFATTILQAGNALILAGDGGLDATGDLTIDTPLISAERSVSTAMEATGDLAVSGGSRDATSLATIGLGADLMLGGAAVDFAGRIVLPSGKVVVSGERIGVGADAVIDVSGETLVFGPKRVGTAGGSIELIADSDDIELASGALLDVSGTAEGGEAGELRLSAQQGNVELASGVQLSGQAPAAAGGRLALDAGALIDSAAPAGNAFTTLAGLLGAGGFDESVEARLREQDLVVAEDTTLTAQHINLSADTGSISVEGTLSADGAQGGEIRLAAGDVLDVSGALSARATEAGASGGRIELYALDADGDDPAGDTDVVHLRGGSTIDVGAGEGGAGGEVFVHARRLDSDDDGQTDQLSMGTLDGEIFGAARADLIATRVLRDPDAVMGYDALLGRTAPLVTITAGRIEAWRAETETFLATLASGSAGPLRIAPGLQIESGGSLVLADRWNFINGWYFGRDPGDPTNPLPGVTGIVTLRAAGDIELRADLTDAFAEQWLFGFQPLTLLDGATPRYDTNGVVTGAVMPQAWGYRLVAGADLDGADVLATGTQPRDLRLGDGVRVRTGTADIDIASSGDVRLARDAAIYAAGWDRSLSEHLKAVMAPVVEPDGLTAYDFFGFFLNGGQFPAGGGSVGITAAGSLVTAAAPGELSAWLTRVGSGVIDDETALYSSTQGYGAVPTHWAVAFEQFRNGVGAFGGGDLRVALGGDLSNVLLAVPGTGRADAGVVADTSSGAALLFRPGTRSTGILPGGNLELRMAGDVEGGQVVVGGGEAYLRTGGTVGGHEAPLLYVGGSAEVDWLASHGLQLAGIQDPTTVALSETQVSLLQLIGNYPTTASIDNRFYTYAPEARVSVGALSGDVAFDGPGFGGLLPPALTAVAFGGDIDVVAPTIEFYPSPAGQVELLARDNVIGNFAGSNASLVRQSDQDPAQLPSVDRPDLASSARIPARIPVHTGDAVPNLIVARDGSIRSEVGKPGFWNLEFAKPVAMQAGLDLANLSVRAQHIDGNDLSSLVAGRDIVQGVLRDNTGRFDTNDRRIFEIWGPGSAEFVAGRNISLGTSAGIESIGNTRNAALSAEGASLRLLAGTDGELASDRFIDVYLSAEPSAYRDTLNEFLALVDEARVGFRSSSGRTSLVIQPAEYATRLGEFLARHSISPIDGDPVRAFRALDPARQRAFMTEVVFSELESWGSAAETADRADRLNYLRGYTVLDTLFETANPLPMRLAGAWQEEVITQVRDYLTLGDPQAANTAQIALFGILFPQAAPRGELSLLLSQVQTLAGGDLAMLVPGGDIDAGAADADIIDKAPSDLGIVTARGGDIDIHVDNDLLVNSTRVFALQGDLLAWSSHGNIDAGKGAKTVTSIPDPITRIDPSTGNTLIEFPPAVSGSGLQGENAALFAPRGAVNAGDAGIRTSGNLTIGAVEVVGADNIDVGGVEIGFSTTDVVAVAPPGASNASSAATRGISSQDSLLSDDGEGARVAESATPLTFIAVEVLGFGGDEADGDERNDDDDEG